eukprot:11291426-Karenia_brevis.AAC.1
MCIRDRSDVHVPHLESSRDESEDEEVEGGPSIEELRIMKVVTRRKKNFDKSKNQSRVSMRRAYEGRPDCKCENEVCGEERWIQGVEGEEPQRMILDFQ